MVLEPKGVYFALGLSCVNSDLLLGHGVFLVGADILLGLVWCSVTFGAAIRS